MLPPYACECLTLFMLTDFSYDSMVMTMTFPTLLSSFNFYSVAVPECTRTTRRIKAVAHSFHHCVSHCCLFMFRCNINMYPFRGTEGANPKNHDWSLACCHFYLALSRLAITRGRKVWFTHIWNTTEGEFE